MKKIFVIIIVVIFGMAAQAMEGGGYSIPSLTISSGGSNNLTSGSYKMIDIKGQSVIGYGTSDDYELGLGGIYSEVGLVEPAPMPPSVTAEVIEGAVILEIGREGDNLNDDLIITWRINTERFPHLSPDSQIDVWMLTSGGSGGYETDGSGWVQVIDDNAVMSGVTGFTSPNTTTKTFKNVDQVGREPNEVYFKGIIYNKGIDDPDYGLAATAAVGKFNALVAKPGTGENYRYSFISVPFVVSDPSANAVFGKQVHSADTKGAATEVWGWTGATFGNQMYLHSSGWQLVSGYTDVLVTPGSGYVFMAKSTATEDKIMTTVGKVLNTTFGPLNMASNRYSFIGNPYPKATLGLKAAGFIPTAGVHGATTSGSSDQFWGWVAKTYAEQVYYNTSTNDWVQISSDFDPIISLGPARTFTYYRSPAAPSGGIDWTFGP